MKFEHSCKWYSIVKDFYAYLQQISCVLTEKICSATTPKLLSDLLQEFPDDDASQAKIFKIVEVVLKAVRNANVSSSHVDAIVNGIIIGFPKYTKPHLVKLVEFCQERISLNDDDFIRWR